MTRALAWRFLGRGGLGRLCAGFWACGEGLLWMLLVRGWIGWRWLSGDGVVDGWWFDDYAAFVGIFMVSADGWQD